VRRCRLILRSLKFLECLETARMERPFVGPRQKFTGRKVVWSRDTHVRGSSNALRDSTIIWPMAPQKTVAKQQTSASLNTVEPLWKAFFDNTSKRLKSIDPFLVFLMLSEIVQFLYCILVMNLPFNAFLAGLARYYSSFKMLLIVDLDSRAVSDNLSSLHRYGNPENKETFKVVSPERCVYL